MASIVTQVNDETQINKKAQTAHCHKDRTEQCIPCKSMLSVGHWLNYAARGSKCGDCLAAGVNGGSFGGRVLLDPTTLEPHACPGYVAKFVDAHIHPSKREGASKPVPAKGPAKGKPLTFPKAVDDAPPTTTAPTSPESTTPVAAPVATHTTRTAPTVVPAPAPPSGGSLHSLTADQTTILRALDPLLTTLVDVIMGNVADYVQAVLSASHEQWLKEARDMAAEDLAARMRTLFGPPAE